MSRTLIIVPTYNERDNLNELLTRVHAALAEADVLIVDDNSPDGTGQLAEEMGAKDPRIKVLRRPGKMGLGTAYLAGFRTALENGYDYVFEMDADLSHDPIYLPTMLAEAVCKLMGFTYAPSQDDAEYWRHGHSTETDFIYVTTQSLTHDALKKLSDEVGPKRTLLICCKAFNSRDGAFENLTIRKIPLTVLSKCEWARDDYSLTIANLPLAPEEEGASPERSWATTPARGRGRAPTPRPAT
mgnify:CR=1 FL=1